MKYLLFIACLVSCPAFAQQQFTPAQQAAANLGQQVGLLMQNNAELATQIQTLNAKLAEQETKLKACVKPTEEKK